MQSGALGLAGHGWRREAVIEEGRPRAKHGADFIMHTLDSTPSTLLCQVAQAIGPLAFNVEDCRGTLRLRTVHGRILLPHVHWMVPGLLWSSRLK
jgi:hypothetical protein